MQELWTSSLTHGIPDNHIQERLVLDNLIEEGLGDVFSAADVAAGYDITGNLQAVEVDRLPRVPKAAARIVLRHRLRDLLNKKGEHLNLASKCHMLLLPPWMHL